MTNIIYYQCCHILQLLKLPNALRGQLHVKRIAIDQVGGQKDIIDNEQGLQMEEWIQLIQNLKVYKSPPSHKQKL